MPVNTRKKRERSSHQGRNIYLREGLEAPTSIRKNSLVRKRGGRQSNFEEEKESD